MADYGEGNYGEELYGGGGSGMAMTCLPVFGACVARITRVDALGNVIAGSNSYVTDKIVSVAVAVNKETGNSFSTRNGCGCGIAKFRAPDVFNWFDLTATFNAFEPEMQAFMLGADTIDSGGDVVGLAYPGTLSCTDAEPAVAFEWWSQNINGSSQDGTLPWLHGVFPMVIWSLGDSTYEEAFNQPSLTGFSRTNTQWGDGPYGDGPPDSADISEGGVWKTADDPPTVECGSQNVTATS